MIRAIAPDALKAIAIFAVVYIHASIPNDATAVIVKTFRFCVPIFIIVWAYFQERSYLRQSSWRANLPNKLLVVLLPFVVWTVIYSVIQRGLPSGGVLSYLSREWAGYGWSGQYFFLILLQLIVLFPLLRQIKVSQALLVSIFIAYALVFALLNAATLPSWFVKISYRPFIYWLPYVALGIYFARHRDVCLPKTAGVVGLSIIVLEALFAWPNPGFDDDYAKPGVLIGSALIAACVLNRAEPVGPRQSLLTRLIFLVGGSTMGIFLLNPLVVRLGQACATAIGWQAPTLTAASAVAASMGHAALVLVVCLVATLALKRIGLGRLVG